MTVQVSVTIWTILCFLAAIVILDRLLFRPLLSFMDARQEKIDSARRRREGALREREETLRRREEDRLAAEKQAMVDASAALDTARRNSARRVAEKKAENEARLARQREELAEESKAIQARLEPQMGRLAAAFANRLQAWQEQEDTITEADETAAPHLDPADEPVLNKE